MTNDNYLQGRDSGIPGIDRAMSPESMANVLAEFVSDDQAPPSSSELAITLLRLKRARRCLLRYDYVDTKTLERFEASFIGKMRARGVDSKTFRLNQVLWNGAFGPSATDGIHVPEPVALLSEPAMYLLRTVHAPTLGTKLNTPDGEGYCYRAGQALHKLHTQCPLPSRRHTGSDELRILREKLAATCHELPALAPRIRNILSASEVLLSKIPDSTSVSLHRDFYPEQLLVDGDRIWLLDLDLNASGDPMLDVGNFIAHLHELSLRMYRHSYAFLSHEQAFNAGYQSMSGCRRSPAIAAYVTLTLVRHIAISRLVARRGHTTADLVTQCERRLALQVEDFSTVPGNLQPEEVGNANRI